MPGYGTGTYGTTSFGGSGGTSTSPGGVAVGVTGWGGVTLWVEMDLSQAVDDVGSGAVAYQALWDVAVWDADQWTDGTLWTDVTEWVLDVQTDRAFSRELSSYTAGRCAVTLDNSDGRFSPDNTSSPYRIGTSTSIGVLRPIRVRASYGGVEWSLFTGRIEEWPETFQGLEGATVTVTAVDAFAELASFDSYEQTPAGASDTFGARIERILTNAGFDGDRRIDVGEHTMQATTLAQNAVTELKLTSDSEGGSVWVGGDGIFYADGQNALIEKARSITVQALFSNSDDDTAIGYEIDSVQPLYDGSQVVNIAAFARVGSTVQTYTSEMSRALYGDRQSERSDLICETDPQVAYLCEREVALHQSPERRIEKLRYLPQLQPSAARIVEAWNALAEGRLMLRSLAQVQHTTAAGYTIDKLVYIRGIHHRISRDNWSVDLDFTSATVLARFYGSRWDVGVWDESAWSW